MVLEDFFSGLIKMTDSFLFMINQGLKLFFNDIQIFNIPLGYIFLVFSLLAIITNYIRGEE